MVDRVNIKEQVDKLLSLPFVTGIFPIPIEEIAQYLGFSCHAFNPVSGILDVSGAVNHQTNKIYVNKCDSARRQFFTVAHEIGHIVLHGANADYIDYRGNVSESKEEEQKEKEANYFAASLLMPEEIFRLKWRECNKSFNQLSNFFGVSTVAIAIRANSIGLD